MTDAPLPRIGVLRPGPAHPIAAEAEARVIRHELHRRLGPVTVDLRIDHDQPCGPWLPVGQASWPAAIDALIDGDDLFGAPVPPLTALFARTVDATAAGVRRRMLDHLGLATHDLFDDVALHELDAMVPTPTDLWLIVGGAGSVSVSDAAVAGFADTSSASVGALDAIFDRIAERLRIHDAVAAAAERTLERTAAERDDLRNEIAALHDELTRERSEFATAIDALAADRAVADLDAGSS